MTPDTDTVYRRDQAVILARGRSSRMGMPKGLVCLPDDERPLLSRVADLYLASGIPVLVVVLREVFADYENILPGRSDVKLLPSEGGAGTARTLATAWKWGGGECTHIWAHPVDVPLVRPETLAKLRQRTKAHPGRVIRPVFADQPGHPVILPCAVLANLDRELKSSRGETGGLIAATGDMRELLAPDLLRACGSDLEFVAVGDSGVARDFDSPPASEI